MSNIKAARQLIAVVLLHQCRDMTSATSPRSQRGPESAARLAVPHPYARSHVPKVYVCITVHLLLRCPPYSKQCACPNRAYSAAPCTAHRAWGRSAQETRVCWRTQGAPVPAGAVGFPLLWLIDCQVFHARGATLNRSHAWQPQTPVARRRRAHGSWPARAAVHKSKQPGEQSSKKLKGACSRAAPPARHDWAALAVTSPWC